ncbi:MAG: four helix bundle protein [Verrucomicrobia bacterium]|nr:MAG: four helix bundle protein [Verrucomicrobiota bacterium]TAE88675.1 MAG: four helix bundle protein [Verrucomicrobiota bacterium]TAF26477.1 MAG: four helix bundle protein [Verrucomicrobiota bacterium]
MESQTNRTYDLEERLLSYGAAIIVLTRSLSSDYAERHVGNQLLRSGTASLSHHGEAQGAESPADFIHKLRLALKELREAERWLKLIARAGSGPSNPNLNPLLDETDQLIRIFVSSIATAEKRRSS